MRKSAFFLAAATLAAASAAQAQVDFEILFDQADIEAARGVGTGEQVDGVGVTSDGSVVYTFDSDGDYDGLLRYTPANDTGAAGAGIDLLTSDNATGGSVDYNSVAALTGAGWSGGASAGDLDVAADGTLYHATRNDDTFLIRVNDGSLPVSMDLLTTDLATTRATTAMVVDNTRGVIFFITQDTFDPGKAEDVYSLPLTAPVGNPNPITRVAEATMAAVLTPLVGGGNELEPYDIAIHPDGDLLIVNGFDNAIDADQDADHIGDIVKATPDMSLAGGPGTAVLWLERNTVLNPVDGGGNTVTFGDIRALAITTAANGRIILGNDRFSADQFLSWVSADGSTHRLIADNATFAADPDIAAVDAGATLGFETKGLAADANGDIYMSNQFSVDAVVKATNIDYELTNVDDWMNY